MQESDKVFIEVLKAAKRGHSGHDNRGYLFFINNLIDVITGISDYNCEKGFTTPSQALEQIDNNHAPESDNPLDACMRYFLMSMPFIKEIVEKCQHPDYEGRQHEINRMVMNAKTLFTAQKTKPEGLEYFNWEGSATDLTENYMLNISKGCVKIRISETITYYVLSYILSDKYNPVHHERLFILLKSNPYGFSKALRQLDSSDSGKLDHVMWLLTSQSKTFCNMLAAIHLSNEKLKTN